MYIIINDNGCIYARTKDLELAKIWLSDAEKDYPNNYWIIDKE